MRSCFVDSRHWYACNRPCLSCQWCSGLWSLVFTTISRSWKGSGDIWGSCVIEWSCSTVAWDPHDVTFPVSQSKRHDFNTWCYQTFQYAVRPLKRSDQFMFEDKTWLNPTPQGRVDSPNYVFDFRSADSTQSGHRGADRAGIAPTCVAPPRNLTPLDDRTFHDQEIAYNKFQNPSIVSITSIDPSSFFLTLIKTSYYSQQNEPDHSPNNKRCVDLLRSLPHMLVHDRDGEWMILTSTIRWLVPRDQRHVARSGHDAEG